MLGAMTSENEFPKLLYCFTSRTLLVLFLAFSFFLEKLLDELVRHISNTWCDQAVVGLSHR